MRTYIFEGFLVSGSGVLSPISEFSSHKTDRVFCSDSYSAACVDISLSPLHSVGLFSIEVSRASDLKNAVRRLKSFLSIESFDFYFSSWYKCSTGTMVSTRFLKNFDRFLK